MPQTSGGFGQLAMCPFVPLTTHSKLVRQELVKMFTVGSFQPRCSILYYWHFKMTVEVLNILLARVKPSDFLVLFVFIPTIFLASLLKFVMCSILQVGY